MKLQRLLTFAVVLAAVSVPALASADTTETPQLPGFAQLAFTGAATIDETAAPASTDTATLSSGSNAQDATVEALPSSLASTTAGTIEATPTTIAMPSANGPIGTSAMIEVDGMPGAASGATGALTMIQLDGRGGGPSAMIDFSPRTFAASTFGASAMIVNGF